MLKKKMEMSLPWTLAQENFMCLFNFLKMRGEHTMYYCGKKMVFIRPIPQGGLEIPCSLLFRGNDKNQETKKVIF